MGSLRCARTASEMIFSAVVGHAVGERGVLTPETELLLHLLHTLWSRRWRHITPLCHHEPVLHAAGGGDEQAREGGGGPRSDIQDQGP